MHCKLLPEPDCRYPATHWHPAAVSTTPVGNLDNPCGHSTKLEVVVVVVVVCNSL